MTSLHPGVTRAEAIAATGWDLKFADNVEITSEPNENELRVLRDLNDQIAKAHGGDK